ncbi:hypothetical protein BZG36_04064 [Bifiguratus adelaidae]|uniref:U6 small nuclear RNA (adenine-(43)-N(6))-methyltransferase n=1 Tax=Bifiguratus adelaidae TaxID=1938954 RepID=A0A261XXU0_9FUNG|nr:hypothetical protein BZG36_04064 [Bifiguratus adelaidae]
MPRAKKRQKLSSDDGDTLLEPPDTLDQFESTQSDGARSFHDFDELAEVHDEFRSFVRKDASGRPYINFQDPKAVRALTYAILKKEFDLDLEIPLDTLCPPVPNRLNYIQLLHALLIDIGIPEGEPVWGIDIGTGASCIYPLLGCASYPNWHFLATDISKTSLQVASDNVKRNKLQNRIHLYQNNDPKITLPIKGAGEATRLSITRFDFCMCNPPFYISREQIQQAARSKALSPSAVCTGNDAEMITEGGEVGFITRMIHESKQYTDCVRWFTSMVGLKSTLMHLLDVLQQEKIGNYVIMDLKQGKTTRWVIGWSFSPDRPKIARREGSAPFLRKLNPQSNVVECHVSPEARNQLLDLLDTLQISYTTESDTKIQVTAHRDTWTRRARRGGTSTPSAETEPMTIRIEFKGDIMTMHWVHGMTRPMFLSFWQHVRQALERLHALM